MKYTGLFQRLIAYILDSIITYIPFAIIFGFKETLTSMEMGIYLLYWTAYFVWMTGMYGATIGKMIMKIKVVKENGKKVNYSDALLREIASYLSMAVVFLGILNIKRQSWHDKIAKTVVVSA